VRRYVALLILLSAPVALGSDLSLFRRYAGYTILGIKTIDSYVDKDGTGKKQFDGCTFDRSIVFDDGTYAVCSEYGYQYAYRPDALLLVKNQQLVMLVDGTAYSMRFQ
jgi:hypothetical protein